MLLSGNGLIAEDWPTWRHDRLRTGITREKLQFPLNKHWTFKSRVSKNAPVPTEGPTRGSYPEMIRYNLPIVAAGDSVYFTSAEDGRVVCLDAVTGEKRWEYLAAAGVNRTPMFWEGKIYTASDDGNVYCLNAETGRELWRYRAAPADRQFLAFGQMVSVWPVRTDVLVDDGVAYFSAGVFPHEGTFVFGLDADTGELLWRNGTQSEDGHQVSLAPAGHLYLTGVDIWIPKDYRGYSMPFYGSPTPFLRKDGTYVNSYGSSVEEDPERPKIANLFWPIVGPEKDGIRYAGNTAWKVEGEEAARQAAWHHPIEGRWVDIESAIGMHPKRDVIYRYDPDLSNVIVAGDTVLHTAFDSDPAKGVGSGIYARDCKDGKLLWSAELPERANQLIVADGRLIAATRSGTIYCFGPGEEAKTKEVEEAVSDSPFETPSDELEAAAGIILEQAQVDAGYALVLDCRSGQLAYELARRTNLYVVAVFANEDGAAAARRAYCRANMHVSRIVAIVCPDAGRLPFPSCFSDLVVSESAAMGNRLPSPGELLRLQKPIRGVALIGGPWEQEQLATWAASTQKSGWDSIEASGRWLKRVRPPLEDGGSWTHMFGDAGNTACSHDGELKGPIGVTWYGPPYIEQPGSHTAMIVNGILVVPEPNALEACDQYTGRSLWKLKAGSVGVNIAASPTHLYSKIAHVIAQIDLQTGKETASYLSAFGKDHPWDWFAVAEDGKTVYGAAGDGLFATEMESGKGNVKWTLGGPDAKEEDQIRSNMIAMTDGRILALKGKANDELRKQCLTEIAKWMEGRPEELRKEFAESLEKRDIRELIAVDAKTGKIVFRRGVDVTNCGGGTWLQPQGFGGKRHYNPYVTMGLYAHNNTVVIASESRSDKGWGVWNSGGYKIRAITAYDATTGKFLWYKYTNHRTRPVIIDNTIHAEPWAYDLRTGEKQQRMHPITGQPADWAWCRSDKQCGIFSASKYFLFGRNKGFGYHDLLHDEGLVPFWHSRSNCFVDHVSGGGLMIKPPQAIYCQCQWSLPFTVAMGNVSTEPTAAPLFAQPGDSLPVKHLHLDFGGNGDRRDEQGNLWLAAQRPINHLLLLGYDVSYTMYPGGRTYRQSSRYAPVQADEAKFVFASAVVGMRRCILPVAHSEDGAGAYRVKLGFVALAEDQTGERVFSVIANGKEVLKDLDVVAETNEPGVALWKEFAVDAGEELVLDFLPKQEGMLPVLCAAEVNRQEMKSVGLSASEQTMWLNKSNASKTLQAKVGNLTNAEFTGKLLIQAPAGFRTSPADLDINVGACEYREIELTLEGSDDAAKGVKLLPVKLLSKSGEIVAETAIALEWLGELERAIVPCGSKTIRQQARIEKWRQQIMPNRQHEYLDLATGFTKPDDGGGSLAYVWFNLPRELHDKKIQAAKLRLTGDRRTGKLLDENATSGPTLQKLVGPPWPDMNQIEYASAPGTIDGKSRMMFGVPLSNFAEASLPGSLASSADQATTYLILQPSDVSGRVLFSNQANDPEVRPIVVIDYLP